MPHERDVFDGILQAEVDVVAPGMVDAIRESLARHFAVGEFTARTVLAADGDVVTIRWAVDCADTARDGRKRTFRDVTVHGVSLVGGPAEQRVVAHYIDWAGVMSQLGLTTSRPSAVDDRIVSDR